MGLPKPFPNIDVSGDTNPAIRLFGKRFINQQSTVEFLAEFLAVVAAQKWIEPGDTIDDPLPSMAVLETWPRKARAQLHYTLQTSLNLKLFALLSSSRVDSRHDVHKQHYETLFTRLKQETRVNQGGVEEALEWLEEFLRGFQGAGLERTWCAQTFYPITFQLLNQETIWNETYAKNKPPKNWNDSIEHFNKYFSISKHRFMARGGELLYLQLCNVFTRENSEINELARKMCFSLEETGLQPLHASLQKGFKKMNSRYTDGLNRLIDYIESLDQDTHHMTNYNIDDLCCEWCPAESWPEGYLFAVEINRLLAAALDPMERLDMLMTGCSLQVLRSLCAQSMRYAGFEAQRTGGGGLGYAWLFSPPDLPSYQQKQAAQRNLEVVEGLIQKAVYNGELQANAGRVKESAYREADGKYGHKLFLFLGKKLGIIVPQKGPGARMIMSDRLLRYLVLTLLKPGERCTYEEFLHRMYRQYGIAVEGENLDRAMMWSRLPVNSSVQSARGSWMGEMLAASGFLTDLSDACSIVHNSFGNLDKYVMGEML